MSVDAGGGKLWSFQVAKRHLKSKQINSTYGADASVLDEHWISTDNMHAFPQPQTPTVDIMYIVLAILGSQLGCMFTA